MKTEQSFRPLTCLLLILTLSPPLFAQTRRATGAPSQTARPSQQSPPTFDTLLAADTYKLYVEIRGVGQVIRSTGVNDLLEPVLKLATPPKEFQALVKWLHGQSDALTSSRLLFATWAARPKIPQVVCAIEFSSAEEARKFHPQLKTFLPKMFPTPAPTASLSNSPTLDLPANEKPHTAAEPSRTKLSEPAAPFVITQSGSLVLLTDAPFTFKALRPAGSKLLSEDQNFRISRNRFSAEPLYVYFNLAQEDLTRPTPTPTSQTISGAAVGELERPETQTIPVAEATPPMVEHAPNDESPPATKVAPVAEQQTPGEQARTPAPFKSTLALMQFSRLLVDGRPRWPEAVSVAIEFEADSYVIRALLLNSDENKGIVIPFMPQLISGPPISPTAPSIFPSDSELVLSMSLDFGQMHDQIAKTAERESDARPEHVPASQTAPPSPFAAYEKMLGIELKKDLLPLLGSEIALSFPLETFMGSRQSASNAATTKPPEFNPTVAVSIKDREATRAVIARMMKSVGLGVTNLFEQTERREDTEIISYAGIFSYAFIGDFLLGSTDPKQVSRVVDSYLKRETLSSNSNFRNFTRWQPRQVLSQLYISPSIADISAIFDPQVSAGLDSKLRDFIMGLSPDAAPVTYALSNEGYGPLHEVHLPKNLIIVWLAGAAGSSFAPVPEQNEGVARGMLRGIASAQATYFKGRGAGRFASIDELVQEKLIPSDMDGKYGYRFGVTTSGTTFEARATPVEYGKTGKMSYFIDESAVLRGADHGGGPATVADSPVQ